MKHVHHIYPCSVCNVCIQCMLMHLCNCMCCGGYNATVFMFHYAYINNLVACVGQLFG